MRGSSKPQRKFWDGVVEGGVAARRRRTGGVRPLSPTPNTPGRLTSSHSLNSAHQHGEEAARRESRGIAVDETGGRGL